MYRSQEADLNIYKEFGHQITVIAANRLESLLLGKIIKKITSEKKIIRELCLGQSLINF
jgi:hypothetical protein